MVNVKRIDLGVDIVALPERNLIVLHPDLTYAEALGAILGVLPDIHPDVARRLVEKVTPRPGRVPVRVVGSLRAAVIVLVAVLAYTLYSPGSPASASARFGPDWSAATAALGLRCQGDSHTMRTCLASDGDVVTMHGYAHQTGTLYVAQGGDDDAIIFVFDKLADADRYAHLHPNAEQHDRAVILT